MRLIDRVLTWNWNGAVATVITPAGELRLTPLADDLIRFTVTAPGGTLVLDSGAVVLRNASSAAATFTALPDRLELSTARVKAVVALNPVRVSWYEGDRLFAREESIYVSGDRIVVTRSLPAGEHVYGLGEKTGYLDKRGRQYEMWATDQGVMVHTDPLYQSIPFYIGLREGQAHGLFVDCMARNFFDMGALDPADTCTVTVLSPVYDSYVFAGPDMRDVVQRYADVTGRMELPPLWSLGYHQCRYSYYPESRVREIAAGFRARQIPCDTLWLDIDYMDAYRVFTWDLERFPTPGQMIHDLAGQGYKVVPIVDPGVKVDEGFPIYQEGVANGYFCKNPDGSVFVGKVWPGPSAFPDFMQAATRRWWGDRHKEAYLGNGIAGIWNDMNEPANQKRNELYEKTLPHYVLQGEEGRQAPHKDVHNSYGFRMSQATFEGLKRHRPDRRPFVLTRSGYAGIQRYAAVWTGDNYSWWEGLADALPMCLGMGLSGVAYVGSDVGGFGENPSGELFARWMQFAALSPFCRSHTAKGNRDQEPWSFGPAVEAVSKQYIELRYRLLPYLYTLFEESSRTGLPVMRPLMLEHQADPETWHIGDQYLLGRDLLVAPVYQPGVTRRLVYLPEGVWYDFWTGERHEGKQYVVRTTPLDIMPMYVRAGAVIPMWPVMQHVGEADVSKLTLHVYAGEGSFTLYEDAGDGYGGCSRTPVTVTGDRVTIGASAGDFQPTWTEIELVLHGFAVKPAIDSGHKVTISEG